VLSELCACLCVEGPFWLKISLSRPSHFLVRPASSGSRATIGFVEPQDLRVQTTCTLSSLRPTSGEAQGKRTTRHAGWKQGLRRAGRLSPCRPLKREQKGGRSKGDSAARCTLARASASEQPPAATVRLPARRGHSNALRTQRQEATRDAVCVAPVTAERRQRRNLAAVRAQHENLQNRRYSR
jgi:hypothetical protein